MSNLTNLELNCSANWDALHFNVRFYLLVLLLAAFNMFVVMGNALVIIAVMMRRRLRSPTGILILSLAVADMNVGILVLPFSMTNEALANHWLFGEIWCQIWLAVDVWMCTASIYNLIAISLDRYIAIIKPLNYPMLITKLRARLMVAAAWTSSFLICLPPILMSWPAAFKDLTDQQCTCSPANNSPLYIIYSAFGSFFIPMAVIAFVYVRIYSAARAATKSIYSGMMAVSNNQKHSIAGQENMPMLRVHRGAKASTVSISGETRGHNRESNAENIKRSTAPSSRSHSRDELGLECTERLHSINTESGRSSVNEPPPNETRFSKLHSRRSSNERWTRRAASRDDSLATDDELADMLTFRESTTSQPGNKYRKSRQMSDDRGIQHARSWLDKVRNTTAENNGITTGEQKQSVTAMSVLKKNRFSKFLQSKRKSTRNDTYHKRLSLEIKAAKTVAIVTGCFVCCWLGFAILYAMQALPHCQRNTDCIPAWMWSAAFWLGYVNSALNPIIYTVFNREFRSCFKQLLTCQRLGERYSQQNSDAYSSKRWLAKQQSSAQSRSSIPYNTRLSVTPHNPSRDIGRPRQMPTRGSTQQALPVHEKPQPHSLSPRRSHSEHQKSPNEEQSSAEAIEEARIMNELSEECESVHL